jgi:hypothetical protein
MVAEQKMYLFDFFFCRNPEVRVEADQIKKSSGLVVGTSQLVSIDSVVLRGLHSPWKLFMLASLKVTI